MKKFNQVVASILGDKDELNQDRYFMTMISFVAAVFLLILCIFHIIMSLKIEPVILAGSSSLLLLGLYFLLRFYKNLFIPKLLVTILGLILLDLTWYSKFLSFGPVLYFIFAFGALVIWVWNGRSQIIMLLIYFANIAVLYLIEKNTPVSFHDYPDLNIRLADIYLSFLLYSLLLIFILSRVKKDFVIQREKAITSDKLKTAFLANMSHEIRTPMNAIVGFSLLLEREENRDKRAEFIKIVQNSSSSLLNLIDDLIDLSKIEAGEIYIGYSNFRVKDLFMEMKEIFTLELAKKGRTSVQLKYELPDQELTIYSDPLRVKQVMDNLIRNAIKFTMVGEITFACRKHGEEYIFSVSDTGVGIPSNDREEIFKRFAKFNYSNLNKEGTGIGLSIAAKIVELLKGRLWLQSEVGEGSSFYFSLPDLPAPFGNKEKRLIHSTPLVEKLKPGKDVLVVEDDMVSYLLLKEILQSMNYTVHHVIDGQQAIDFLKKNPRTQLILMDLQLPVMNGYDATLHIKKALPKIPIIAQTAYAMVGDKEEAMKVGFDDYITKPINPLELQEMLWKYL